MATNTDGYFARIVERGRAPASIAASVFDRSAAAPAEPDVDDPFDEVSDAPDVPSAPGSSAPREMRHSERLAPPPIVPTAARARRTPDPPERERLSGADDDTTLRRDEYTTTPRRSDARHVADTRRHDAPPRDRAPGLADSEPAVERPSDARDDHLRDAAERAAAAASRADRAADRAESAMEERNERSLIALPPPPMRRDVELRRAADVEAEDVGAPHSLRPLEPHAPRADSPPSPTARPATPRQMTTLETTSRALLPDNERTAERAFAVTPVPPSLDAEDAPTHITIGRVRVEIVNPIVTPPVQRHPARPAPRPTPRADASRADSGAAPRTMLRFGIGQL